MKTISLLILSCWSLIVTGCVAIESKQPLSTIASVDLTRYAGTWYEIARRPMWFQRHCVGSKAIYTTRPDGKIGVHNECVTQSGEIEHAEGVATIIDRTTNARLAVTFDNFFARLVGPLEKGTTGSSTLTRTTAPPSSGHRTVATFGSCLALRDSTK